MVYSSCFFPVICPSDPIRQVRQVHESRAVLEDDQGTFSFILPHQVHGFWVAVQPDLMYSSLSFGNFSAISVSAVPSIHALSFSSACACFTHGIGQCLWNRNVLNTYILTCNTHGVEISSSEVQIMCDFLSVLQKLCQSCLPIISLSCLCHIFNRC